MNYVFIWPSMPTLTTQYVQYVTNVDEFLYSFKFNIDVVQVNITDWNRTPQFWPRG